jgi:hypothetical protein
VRQPAPRRELARERDLPPPLSPMMTIRSADEPIAMSVGHAAFGTKSRPN